MLSYIITAPVVENATSLDMIIVCAICWGLGGGAILFVSWGVFKSFKK